MKHMKYIILLAAWFGLSMAVFSQDTPQPECVGIPFFGKFHISTLDEYGSTDFCGTMRNYFNGYFGPEGCMVETQSIAGMLPSAGTKLFTRSNVTVYQVDFTDVKLELYTGSCAALTNYAVRIRKKPKQCN